MKKIFVCFLLCCAVAHADVLPEGADRKSYQKLEYGFSKDKKHVFRYGDKLEGADPETFVVLEYGYAKDKRNVYFDNITDSGLLPTDVFKYRKNNNKKIIQKADTETFEILNYVYTKDSKHVYSYGIIIDGADLKSFKVLQLNGNYAKDKNHAYYEGRIIDGVDLMSFEGIDIKYHCHFWYAKDKSHLYFIGEVVKDIEPAYKYDECNKIINIFKE